MLTIKKRTLNFTSLLRDSICALRLRYCLSNRLIFAVKRNSIVDGDKPIRNDSIVVTVFVVTGGGPSSLISILGFLI